MALAPPKDLSLYDPTDMLANLKFGGTSFESKLLPNLRQATGSFTVDQLSEISITISDPDQAILESGYMGIRTAVTFDDYPLQVGTFEFNGDENANEFLDIKARPTTVRKLKERTGKLTMKKTKPSDFVKKECKTVGVPYVVQELGKKADISRDVPKAGDKVLPGEGPSSWTTFQRLASENDAMVYESRGVVYFGTRSWLVDYMVKNGKVTVVYYKNKNPNSPYYSYYLLSHTPQCSQSIDNDGAKEITVKVPIHRWKEFEAGRVMRLSGVAKFDGDYQITSVEYDLTGYSLFMDVTGISKSDALITYKDLGKKDTDVAGKGGGGVKVKPGPSPYGKLLSTIDNSQITEASWMVYSALWSDLVYVGNDEPGKCFTIQPSTGKTIGSFDIGMLGSSDPESADMHPDGKFWIADIGNNKLNRKDLGLYRMNEPGPGNKGSWSKTRYHIVYPNGKNYNAESLLIHPITGDMYIITKSEGFSRLFKVPALGGGTNTLIDMNKHMPELTADAKFTLDGQWALIRSAPVEETLVYKASNWTYAGTIPTPIVTKCESLTIEPGGDTFLIGSEGKKSPIYRVNIPPEFQP